MNKNIGEMQIDSTVAIEHYQQENGRLTVENLRLKSEIRRVGNTLDSAVSYAGELQSMLRANGIDLPPEELAPEILKGSPDLARLLATTAAPAAPLVPAEPDPDKPARRGKPN